MSADRNLLFGMLALHNGLVTREQLIHAMTAWLSRKETPLGDLLREQGVLTEDDQSFLDGFVARQVRRHGDTARSLASLRVDSSVRDELHQLGDAEVQASLAPVAPGDDRATNAPAESGRPGTRYRRLRPHAKGGLGEVSVALDEELRREVALKEIQERFADHPNSRARFLREAEITGNLEHPGVVPVYGLSVYPDGRPFYAMRFIRGESMKEAICRFHEVGAGRRDPGERSLALRDLLGRFVAVCDAVAYAHSRGVIHRDLKPANVMLGEYGETLVVDWGLARVLDLPDGERTAADRPLPIGTGGGAPTEVGEAIGTPAYMPPEQAAGRPDLVGPASDVFSLGATLYALLTGGPPYAGEDALAQARRAEAPPARRGKQVPAALEAVCRKAMRPEREGRYATARALADEVRHWLADEPVTAYREPVAARVARWSRRHRTLVTTTAAVGLVTLVGLVVGLTVVSGLNRQLDAANSNLTATNKQLKESNTDLARQRNETKKERDVAVAVNDFLRNDLLGQADIGNQPFLGEEVERDQNITVAELLGRAAASIEGRFQGQEETEASIRQTIGDAYQALGRYEQARSQLERSAAVRGKELGADHPDTLSSKNSLALLYHHEGKPDKAEPLYLEALRQREKKLGADHPDTLASKNNLAALYHHEGKYDNAEPLFLEALRQRAKKLGADHSDTLLSMSNLAVLYCHQGKPDKAEPLFLEALRQSEQKLGADHPSTLVSKNNLALLYRSQGKHDKAEPLLLEALRQREKKLGAEHPDTLLSMSNLALLYRDQRKYDKAEPLFLKALRLQEKKLGADHTSTLTSMSNLALLYHSRGKHDKAEPLFLEALRQREKKLGAEHPSTLASKNNLAVLYHSQGKHDKAEPLFLAAVDGATSKLGFGHPHTQTFLSHLVSLYEKWNAPEKAEPLLRRRLDFVTKKSGADSPLTAAHMTALALNLLQQKNHADAEKLLRECLRIREKAQPDLWTTFNTQSILGEALLRQDKPADAEPLLVQGYDGLKQRAAKIPRQFRTIRQKEALERLVALYDATGKKDEAAKYRQELDALTKAAKPPPKK